MTSSSVIINQVSSLYTGNVVVGYNKILLQQPISVIRGSMIFVDAIGFSARISIDTSGDAMYSDYIWSGTTLSKISLSENWRLMLRAIIEQPYYENLVQIPFDFNTIPVFDRLMASNLDNPVNNITRQVNLTNGMILFF